MEDADLAPIDVVVLGAEAQRLLDDPVLKLAYQRVADKLLATFKNSSPAQVAEREEAYRLYWALEALRGELNAMIGAAKLKQRT